MRSSIRNYQSADEGQLLTLWRRAHEAFGGYVPKNIEGWRWAVLARPGMQPEDILILENEHVIIGYGVLGQKRTPAGPIGTVLELAIEPQLPARQRRKSTCVLMAALEARSRARGDEWIEAAVPASDKRVARAIEKAGYKPEKSEAFQLAIVDPRALLEQILTHRKAELPPCESRTFALTLEPGAYRFRPFTYLRIQLPSRAVTTEHSPTPADYTIATDLSCLTDIVFHRASFERAVDEGRISVQPTAGLSEVRRFFQLITLRHNWYTPNVDGR